jgi:hypothetical protein
MTPARILTAAGLGIVLWFIGSVYIGVLIEGALPERAAELRDSVSAALFPFAMLSAFVLVWQGHGRGLVRFTTGLVLAGVAWFPAAALVGAILARSELEGAELGTALRSANALLLIGSLAAVWLVARRIGSAKPELSAEPSGGGAGRLE